MEATADPVLNAVERQVFESARASVLTALKQGFPADRLIATLERAILPAVEAALPANARQGYAAPSEGFLALAKAEGGCMRVDEAREALGGISRQAVNERIKRGTLVAAKMPNGQYALPRWQFDSRGEIHGAIPSVLQALIEAPGYSPLTAFAFFLQPSPALSHETPLAVMKKGGSAEQLTDAARDFGRQ